jgi:hypothetical protein
MNTVSARKTMPLLSILGVVVLFAGNAYSQDSVLLDCRLDGGYPDIQIYIDQLEGYVLYNAHLRDSYERKRTVEDEIRGHIVIDEGLDITANNDAFILASDESASFVLVKETATYAYAWTMPVPMNAGKFVAFGNHHTGKCSINPFARTN